MGQCHSEDDFRLTGQQKGQPAIDGKQIKALPESAIGEKGLPESQNAPDALPESVVYRKDVDVLPDSVAHQNVSPY